MATATPPSPLKGCKILLIEDNDQLYRALRESLTEAGGDVLGAVAFMPRGTGMLPLTNIHVAVMDTARLSTCMALALELQQRAIPCVFIATEPLHLPEQFPHRYLSKPFTEDELLEHVSALFHDKDPSKIGSDIRKGVTPPPPPTDLPSRTPVGSDSER